MKRKNYFLRVMILLLVTSFVQSLGAQTVVFDTAVETESEVEAEAEVGQVAGAVAVAAGAAANFPNSNASIMLSGGLAKMVGIPATITRGIETNNLTNLNNSTTGSSDTLRDVEDNNIFLAESEVEVEAEAEVEVNNGSSIAVGGTATGAAGIAASKYSVDNGDILLWPSNAITAVNAMTSTSAKVSEITIPYEEDTSEPVSGSGESQSINSEDGNFDFDPSIGSENTRMPLPNDVIYAGDTDIPVEQVETATETEVEVEVEVEAETAMGAAGAVATGGAATSVAGDYGVAISSNSVITSVSTSVVNDSQPILFNVPEPSSNNTENTGSGNENGGSRSTNTIVGQAYSLNRESSMLLDASELAEVPTEENGKGLSSFETEAESEVEAAVEVDNGSAAAAAIAAAGSGANGVSSSASGSSTSAASTSTQDENGEAVRANDQIFFSEDTRLILDSAQPASYSEAEATAGADASSMPPETNVFADGVAIGDANAYGELTLEDSDAAMRSPGSPNGITDREELNFTLLSNMVQRGSMLNAVIASTTDSENEAEVEAEAEAEVGFNAAAAAAAASAVQGKNGVLPTDSQTSSSSSTSTKVFNGFEQLENLNDSFTPDGLTIYPDFGVDYSNYEYETEAETEAEAEVGFNAAAAAVSASAAGYEDIQIETSYQTTPYAAAAAAAAAGLTVTTSITMPAGNTAGDVTATATAEDPMGRGVSVAVAVAGVPTENGIENELEDEAAGAEFATVSVTVFTDPANAINPLLIGGYNSTAETGQGGTGPQSGVFGESEAESESEAEAGYGVAAAAASAGAAGRGAKSEAFTSTSTLDYTAGYDFTENLFALTEAGVSRDLVNPTNVTLVWNGFGYTQFSIQQKNTDGDFVEIGEVNRATEGIWESYVFTVSNVTIDLDQEFKIVPLEDNEDSVTLVLLVDPALGISDEVTDILENPFPNPVSDVLNIPLNIKDGERYEVTIIDVTGKIINILNSDNLGFGKQTIIWNPNSSLANGMYILKLSSQVRIEIYKVLLQR